METVGSVLKRFDPRSGKFISREFQAYGLYLSQKLEDEKHKSLYIKLSKTVPRYLLDDALTFVLESKADNKGALFMWKLKELRKLLRESKTKNK